MMTFMFPPSMLPLSRSRFRELTAVRVPAIAGLGDLTSQFLLQLAGDVDTTARPRRRGCRRRRSRFWRLGWRTSWTCRDWGTPEGRRHALLTTVQAFIQQHLGDPELSPAAVAAAHHISLRSLHQLFHDEGSDRGGLDPPAATRALPPRPLRSGAGRPIRRGHRRQVGLLERERLQPGIPGRARRAPRRVPQICTRRFARL